MWNMRWKLISLSAALITVTSAQFLTIDNAVIVQPFKNVTLNPEDQDTDSLSDDMGRDENYFSNSSTYNAPPPNSRALSSDSSSVDDGEVLPDPPNVSESSLSSRLTRETSEESRWNKKSMSEENASNEAVKSNENLSRDKSNSTENSLQENSISKEDSIEKAGDGGTFSEVKPEGNEFNDSSVSALNYNSSSVSKSSNRNDAFSGEPYRTGDEQIIQTTHGPVKGYQWHEISEIMGFIDIPYGNFNGYFEAPDTAQSWLSQDVHDVKEHTKRCPQLQNEDYIGDTDCLTLSIFAPKDAENASVLFHIHDGYSNSKSGDPSIYGPDYLVPKGVILVLPNYRLGPMGFLCMQNETALGNAGLKDLALALEWVLENIHFFGGNRANIVVSGDGAAGAYAGYLALCSRSKSYINKVITESGSALSHWALDRDPIGTAYKLAAKIRSGFSDGALYNNTFAEAGLEAIIRAATGMKINPCIENDKEPFMNNTPWEILLAKEIDTTFMIGSAIYAGTHEAVDTMTEFVEQLNANFGQFLPKDLRFKNEDERTEFAQQLKEQYFKEENITTNDVNELSLWYTDASYLGPGIRLARPLLKAGATVYLYEFAFVGSLNRELEALNRPVSGAVRGDIVGYLFHKDGTTVDEESPEKHMINMMVDLWVSFINTGKPEAENVEWNELKIAEDSEEEWLIINSEPKPVKGVHLDRMRLWTSLYEEHFIEHNNSAFRYQSHHCLHTFIAVIMCWMANNKFNYGNQ